MAKILFKLRNVPDDEAQDVREILESNNIEYFETTAGNWGVSVPALWTNNTEHYDHARSLIDEYELNRSVAIKKEYELGRQRGETRTMWNSFIENPVRFVLYLALIGGVLFLSLQVFLSF
ncbi:MAG TPA: hypothetical protein EYG31_11420 [Porticoccaceae bacterium]|jgi:hypothetical protein|nr:hypothetical protein [Gammaproteobacteria bacterium]HIL61236.1 hypothetical protein [Porticoccaceae bacterium]